jgi:serine/threonine protein kinase
MRENSVHLDPTFSITGDLFSFEISDETEDFSEPLTSSGINYKSAKYYWQIGEPEGVQGWILHLTAVRSQITRLLNLVVPILLKESVPFKIPKTRSLAESILYGTYGSKHLGKIIGIYPSTDQAALDLATRLVSLTKDFKGPAIPTDFCLENVMSTRYGSFSPVFIKNELGKPIKHIYNAKDELVPDPYYVPFSFPSNVAWPFHQIVAPILPKATKLLNARYYPISSIKRDLRGNVIKAIYFKRLWDIKACIIKQAEKNMGTDEFGRDFSHRLKWQYDLCTILAGTIPLPKIFDYFTENGNTFLAIEFVKGKPIHKWLENIYNGQVWFDLSVNSKRQILQILLQIIDIVSRLHEREIVHRDIAPGNFIITPRNEAIPIDLELAWNLNSDILSPPFLLGTPGYMSPQQASRETPSIKDDIYALGALIMEACTNISPTKFPTYNWQKCQASLLFFTKSEKISTLIADCLQEDASKRPHLSHVQLTVKSLVEQSIHLDRPATTGQLDLNHLKSTIQAGLNGLACSEMLSRKECWLSFMQNKNAPFGNDQEEMEHYEGWHTGMAGPLWIVALAKSGGFDIRATEAVYANSWEYIHNHYFKDPEYSNPSLYHGGAGISMALVQGLSSELLANNTDILGKLQRCFSARPDDQTLSSGVAGQGIAAIYAAQWLGKDYTHQLLTSYADVLTNTQQPDGSWEGKTMSLDNGEAGITWFLLAYLKQTSDLTIKPVITKALEWIISNKATRHTWKRIKRNPQVAWGDGQSAVDITILLLKSFELLGEERYRQLAEANLHSIPSNLISYNFTLNSGLARLGELYLEAHRLLPQPIWENRATWIANCFLHTFLSKESNAGYWSVYNTTGVTADLFMGNAGILHFLMRYLNRELSFPL